MACSKANQCKAIKQQGGKGEWCLNCGFKFLDRVSHRTKPAIKKLKEGFFLLCSTRNNSRARLAFDKPFKRLFQDRFPALVKLNKAELNRQVKIGGRNVAIRFKCDGAFRDEPQKGRKPHYVFYELKNAGLDTNGLFSAILSAQLVNELFPHGNKYRYFYLGSWGGGGIRRKDFFNEKKPIINPAARWAENKGLIRFYGICDLEEMFDEIENFLASSP